MPASLVKRSQTRARDVRLVVCPCLLTQPWKDAGKASTLGSRLVLVLPTMRRRGMGWDRLRRTGIAY